MSKMKLSPEVLAYFQEIGRRNGERLKKKSKEEYGDSSEYFRIISRKRKRFGRLSKKALRERKRLEKASK